MQQACARRDVRLPAAAIQFALSHPAVSSVVVGARTPAEIVDDVADASTPIDDEVWSSLIAL